MTKPKKITKCKHCKGTGEEPCSHNKDYEGLSCLECNGMGEIKNEYGEL